MPLEGRRSAFTAPVRVGAKDNWQMIRPTAVWKRLKTPLKKDDLAAATDLYYINVSRE